MGLRLRLKASFSLAGYHGQSLVILKALKNYGMIVADNGSSWYITGAADKRWNDDDLNQLKRCSGLGVRSRQHRRHPPLTRNSVIDDSSKDSSCDQGKRGLVGDLALEMRD